MRLMQLSARRQVLGLIVSAALCACAASEEATVSEAATSAQVPQELFPVMPAPQPAPSDAPVPMTPGPEDNVMDTCNADNARSMIGRVATPEVIDAARKAAGAQSVRTLKPGQMVTMEFSEGRLNIDVDADNVVTNVRCG